jgi:diguanylate cyclase (GGDEF)-like protein/PAS domain S-box-containing protein
LNAPLIHTCLLVDDNPDDRALVMRALLHEFPAMQVRHISDMDGFADALQHAHPDLIVTDYHLGWSTGLILLQHAKAALPDCPVIMFTGTGSEEIAVEAMQAGLDDYVLKAPRHYSLLPTRIRSILARQQQQKLLQTTQLALRDSEARLRAIIDSGTDYIGMFGKDGSVTYINQAGRTLLEIGLNEDIGSTRIPDYMPPWCVQIMLNEAIPQAVRNGVWNGECALMRRDGTEIPVSAVIAAHKSADGSIDFFSGIMRDISERKRYEAQLSHLATHDVLTGLPNRALFTDRLEVSMHDAKRQHQLVAVMALNLDHFKTINDSLGHEIGNALLRAVAGRLDQVKGDNNTLARLSGDEFALVCGGLAQLNDASELAQALLGCFKTAFHIDGHELFLTTSIGIAVYPSDDRSAIGLLKNAAIALNRSKDLGGDTHQFYDASMNAQSLQHLMLSNALHHVLARDELQLHYQPQINLKSGEICGMEALLRWHHPQLGTISPTEFIPIAEKTGLIVAIGEWVLRTACQQSMAWQLAGLPALPIAINLSGRQFAQPALAQTITDILTQTGLAPHLLELEITESTLIQDTQASIAALNALTQLGIRISIDDFGTGYSSLSYLKSFPINAIKIDQSFVRDIHTDPDDAAIVSAIIAMAKSLGMETIAEGVETNEQLAFLQLRECDSMQGFLFSKPVNGNTLKQLLQSGKNLSNATP